MSKQMHDAAHSVVADLIEPAALVVDALGCETEVEVVESATGFACLRWLWLSSAWKLKLLPFEQGLLVQISSQICLPQIRKLVR